MKKKSELAKTKKGEVSMPYNYGEDAGVGMDLTLDDLKIPFVALMQNESKALDPDEESYVPGGEPGQILNTKTKEYSDELILVPAYRKISYVEWLPDRQGFAAEHDPSSPVVREAKANAAKRNELYTQQGNQLEETKSLYCIVLDQDGETPIDFCVVSFTSSKMVPWREYFTALDSAKATKGAPLFAHSFRLTSVRSERKGKKFFNYRLVPLRDADGNITNDPSEANVISSMIAPDSQAYAKAKEMRDAIESGRATGDKVPDEESGDSHF